MSYETFKMSYIKAIAVDTWSLNRHDRVFRRVADGPIDHASCTQCTLTSDALHKRLHQVRFCSHVGWTGVPVATLNWWLVRVSIRLMNGIMICVDIHESALPIQRGASGTGGHPPHPMHPYDTCSMKIKYENVSVRSKPKFRCGLQKLAWILMWDFIVFPCQVWSPVHSFLERSPMWVRKFFRSVEDAHSVDGRNNLPNWHPQLL